MKKHKKEDLYSRPDRYEAVLLKFLKSHKNKTYHINDLINAVGLNDEHTTEVKRALRHLVTQKEVIKLKKKRYTAAALKHRLTARFEAGRYNDGYAVLEDKRLYIPKGFTGTALPGDTIKLEVLAGRKGREPEARVIGILNRGKHEFVGVFTKEYKNFFVNPDSAFMKWPVFIPETKTKKAKPGQRVVIVITSWENEYINPTGKIVEIIGYPDEKGVNSIATARSFGIPVKFPDKVLEEAENLKIPDINELAAGRKDFRKKEILTIDPEEAKDFDDAVSLEKLPDGNLLLGVYIADVTAYIPEDSAIDKEAQKRGTSVYLLDKVIPMLPEKLSNELCSLRENEDKAVYCVLMKCTPAGDVIDFEFHEGLIRSVKRFNYNEVQEILDGNIKNRHSKLLRKMNDFAGVLKRKRFAQGGMDFYTPEVEFELDENEKPISINIRPVLESHNLIEEFMLLANIAASVFHRKLEEKLRDSLPFVYRVHEEPDEEKVMEFASLARSLGCNINNGEPGSSPWFQGIMTYFKDKPEKNLVEDIALRSMMKALYQTKNIGHFGLAFKEYTHFTSPIRRYPDLIVHRLLKKYSGDKKPGSTTNLKRTLTNICKNSSETEIRAVRAEREVVKMKKLQYMEDKLGEVYSGIITGVTSFGIFVELSDILIDGLVHIRDLGEDYFIYEEVNYKLTGDNTGKTYQLGDKVTVQVITVNVERGHLDLLPVEDE
ncbi:MAG: ribonuclease R [bacterium]|nr:ribonuclease R [bacterium]